MARPQNNPGMPSNTRSVSASPVDLTEFTGNAGMPVSPTPLAKPPAQPDLQAYRDSQALASSFSTLSATLGQYGMSVERVGQMYEDFGEETAGLVEFLKSEGKTFANALSTDQIEALEHPRAMVGASRGTAKLRAREMDSMFSEGLSELKLGDGALDPDTYAKAYDSMIAPYIQNYKGPRSDVFAAEFLTEASRLRSGQMVKARKWISDELIKQGEQEINYEVDSILTVGLERERDSIVESDLYDPNDLNPAKAALGKLGFAKTKRIIGDTDEEHYEKVVSEAQLSLQNYIDGQEGEMFSLRNVTEIAGKRLVQLAAGNSRMSGLAQELLNTPVGPKNGRVALKDHPAVREAYLNNEDRILRSQKLLEASTRKEEFGQSVEALSETWRGQMREIIDDSHGHIDPQNISSYMTQSIFKGERKIVLENGYVMERSGSKVTVYSPEGEFDSTLDMKDLADSVQEERFNQELEKVIEESPYLHPLTQNVLTSINTGIKSPEFSRAASVTTSRLNSGTYVNISEEEREVVVTQTENILQAYRTYKNENAGKNLDKYFNNKEDHRTFQYLDILTSSDMYGSVGDAMNAISDADYSGGNIAWEELNIDTDVFNPYKAEEEGIIPEMSVDIETLATALVRTGVSPESAVDKATEKIKEGYLKLPGSSNYVAPSDINSAYMSDNLPMIEEDGRFGFLSGLGIIGEALRFEGSKLVETVLHSPELGAALFGEVASTIFIGEQTNQLEEVRAAIISSALQGLKSSERRVTLNEFLTTSANNFMTNPPDDFVLSEHGIGDDQADSYEWRPIRGTKMNSWKLIANLKSGDTKEIYKSDGRAFHFNDIYQMYGRSIVESDEYYQPTVDYFMDRVYTEEMINQNIMDRYKDQNVEIPNAKIKTDDPWSVSNLTETGSSEALINRGFDVGN